MALFDYTAPNYNTVGETEEERRRREMEEADRQRLAAVSGSADQARAAAETGGAPIKQTITYDPVTGEQRMKIEGSVQDLSPANALTPTVTMPGQMPEATQVAAPVKPPELGLQKQFETPAVPAQPTAPTAMPAEPQRELPAGVQMVNGKLQLAAAAPEVAQVPTPGPGVQVAGAPGAPMPQMPAAQPAPAAAPGFTDMWTQAGSDPTKFLAIRNDTSLTPEQRRLAGREASRLALMEGDRGDQEAAVKQKMAEAASTGNFNDIAKMMKTQNEEGSWGRRILFGMLGMEAAVKDEEAKLGIGAKWQSTTVTDSKGNAKNVLVKTRADGLPIEGYDADTGSKLGVKELAGVATSGQKLGLVGGTYVNDRTGEVGRVVTNEKTGQSYVQTDTGRKPLTGFRPQATAGTLADQLAAQQQRAGVGLQYAAPTAAAQAGGRVAGETSATFGTPLQVPQQMPVGPAAGVPAPQMPAAPAPQMPAAPAPQMAPQAPAPVSPQQLAQQQAVPAAPVAAAAPVARPAVPGVPAARPGMTPAQLQTQQALTQKAGEAGIETAAVVQREKLKPPAAEEGKQVAIDIKNQAFADKTYGLMKPINEAILASTGSTIGAGVDTVAAAIGKSTEGSKAISRLNVLSYGILSNIPRFEGPQSDIDVQMYKQAAGDFANRKLPVEDRLAALGALRDILQRYDKAGKNDWSFGTQSPSTSAGTTSSGNKYKKVQ